MISRRTRVAVIGAGIVGACSGLALQRHGHDVVMIDPNSPGEGASFGNAGCFNGSSVVPMSMPGVVMSAPRWIFDPLGPLSIRWRYLVNFAPWLWRFVRAGQPHLVQVQARALRGLLAPTVKEIMSLAEEAGAQHLIRHEGHLYVYRTEAGFEGDKSGWELRNVNGVRTTVLDASALRDFDASLSKEFVRGVFIEENGHTTDPHRLVTMLVGKVIANGGKLIRAAATGFDLDGGLLRGIRTSAGDVSADAAVIAAGAFSKPFASLLGDQIPLDTERGYHLVLADPEAVPRVPTTDAEGKFVANAMDAGLRLAGTVEFGGLSAPPDWRRARVLLRHARRLLPAISEDYSENRMSIWMGFRPSMPDSLPVIGRSRISDRIVYAFGHGHVGMTAAPMTAKIVAELVTGDMTSIDISPFRPSRFSTVGSR